MLVKLNDISSALSKVNALIASDKQIPGVMLRISDNSLSICFNNIKKAMIERIDAVTTESDIKGDIALEFNRLNDIISICQPTGNIVVDDIEFVFEANNIIKIKADKKMVMATEDGESIESIVSSFEQTLKWTDPTSTTRLAVLTRINYDDIVKPKDNYDSWEAKELRETISRMSTEKASVCYIAPRSNIGFVLNLAYATCIPLPSGKTINCTAQSTLAKSISDILGKLNDGQQLIHLSTEEDQYCTIASDDGTFGMWFQMAKPNATHLRAISLYREKAYNSYQFTFIKEPLLEVVKAAIKTDKSEKTLLTFADNDFGDKQLCINSTNSGASIDNDYAVKCAGYIGHDDKINELQIPVSLSALNDMLSNCNTAYVGLDVLLEPDGAKTIRISEIDLEKRMTAERDMREQVKSEAYARLNQGTSENVEIDNILANADLNNLKEAKKLPIPTDKLMEVRSEYLGVSHYSISAK